MKEVAAVFIGGGLGSLARYGISLWLNPKAEGFFWGTLSANVLSSLVLGIILGVFYSRSDLSPWLSGLLIVGFCGGFSTFSTFTSEFFYLLEGKKIGLAGLHVALNIVLCLGGLVGGIKLVRLFA